MIPVSEYPEPSPGRGIALKATSVISFTVMAAMLKAVSDTIPAGEIVFFRSAFATLPIVIALVFTHQLAGGIRTNDPFQHVVRSVFGTVAMFLSFAALAYLPLPEATALGYAAPIMTVVFAAILLREKVRFVRLGAVALGMCGVLIVLWPEIGGGLGGTRAIGASIALCAACVTALVQIQIRRMVGTERPTAIVFWFSTIASLLALGTIPFGWVMPTPMQAMLLVGAGLVGGVAQILLTSSYRYADASVIAPFEYVSIIMALFLGYVFFGDLPAPTTLIGAAVVISAGVIIILRERQLGLQRRAQRKAMTL